MTRSRRGTVHLSGAATLAQTRALRARSRALVPQLRGEIGVPETPAGHAALVMLMGLPGVGKSYCGRQLSARLGAAHVATDHLRSRLFVAPSYTAEENAAVFAVAEALVDQLLGEGHVVVLDATHLLARNRAPAERVARARGVRIHHVLVTADDDAARARLVARTRAREAEDHSDADVRVYERMRARDLEPPAGGHLEIRNGPGVAADIARVADIVRSTP